MDRKEVVIRDNTMRAAREFTISWLEKIGLFNDVGEGPNSVPETTAKWAIQIISQKVYTELVDRFLDQECVDINAVESTAELVGDEFMTMMASPLTDEQN